MPDFAADLKLAARSLRRSPLFAIPAVITLALAIGVACAMFAVLWTVVLRPLPFPDSGRLVSIFGTRLGRSVARVSLPDLRDFEAQCPSLEASAAYRDRTFTLDAGKIDGELPVVVAGRVTHRFLTVLGIAPALGRDFTAADAKVAILTHATWRERFAADPAIVGKTLRLNDELRTIVGVLPQRFAFSIDGRQPAVYIPLEGYEGRAVRGTRALGRLRKGATLAQAQRELATVAARLAAGYPATNANWSAGADDLHRALVGDRAQPLLLLMGAVLLLFLIALFNVANLVLARATARLRESAIRIGLGASTGQEFRRHLAEGFLLSAAGGLLGILLGVLLVPALGSSDRLVPAERLRAMTAGLHPGWPALALGGALTALTILLCACAPLWLQRGLDPHRVLQRGSAALSRSGRSPGAALVVAEVASSAVLLLFAGLFLRSLLALFAVDPGFSAERVVTFGVGLPEIRYDTEAKQAAFFHELLRRIRALAGVESASAIFGLPMSGARAGTWIRQSEADERRPAVLAFAAPRYFETLRVPLLAGRTLQPSDGPSAPLACVISKALARAEFGDRDPLGQQVMVAAAGEHVPPGSRWTVVGVVGDVHQTDLATAPVPQIYLPYEQLPGETLQIVLRTAASAAALAEPLRVVMRSIDGNLERIEPRSLEAQVARTTADRRSALTLLLSFAGLALALTAIGLYAVVSLLVAQRNRELGIRIALGARPGQVLSLVLGFGVRLSLAGLTLGFLASIAGGKLVQAQLPNVSPADLPTYACAALVLLAVALVACLVPALRATRVRPMSILHDE